MREKSDREVELFMYWRAVYDARRAARVVNSVEFVDDQLADELEVMQMWSDWPRLRARIADNLSQKKIKCLDSAPVKIEGGP